MSDKLVDLLRKFRDGYTALNVYEVAAEIREIVKEEIRQEQADPSALDAMADRSEP